MDIQREGIARKKKIRRAIYSVVCVAAFATITLALSRLEPAAPSVSRATVWMDTVQRGLMLRQVRGPGTLVPVEIRWITARTNGLVEQITLPGNEVKANTVLIEMSNPELEQAALDSDYQLRAAEAQMADLKVQLKSELLNQRAKSAAVQAEFNQAQLQAESDQELHDQGLIGDLTLKLSTVRVLCQNSAPLK